jgi:predicted dienelactone hydrolase
MTSILLLNSIYAQEKTLPKPSGKYPIGAKYLVFVDKNRPEIFSTNTSDHREITVKAWYPAAQTSSVAYTDYIKDAKETVRLLNLPEVYENLKTHSKLDLPISKAKMNYPVLIFNHGWGEHFAQNTVLMEELTSHGYIVFSIAHHYECKFSFYPDGRYITFDPNNSSERFKKIMEEQRNPEALQVFQQIFEARTYKEQKQVFQRTSELLPTLLTETPRLWSQDIRFIIDQLEILNKSKGLFYEKLNLTKIGVFGMSAGGIAAQQVCMEDKRCIAGISMDGGFYGDSLKGTISQAFMFMNSYRFIGYEDIFLDHLKGPGIVLTFPNADHYNFHEASILEPLHSMLGNIDGYRMLKILNDYTLAFFNKYIKGEAASLLDGPSKDYPEVKFKSRIP